jgi:hypothetical protein
MTSIEFSAKRNPNFFYKTPPNSQLAGLLLKIFRHNSWIPFLLATKVYVAYSSIRFLVEPWYL